MAANIENDLKIPINASRSLQRKVIATILFLILVLVAFESSAEDDKKFYTECAISQGNSVERVKQF